MKKILLLLTVFVYCNCNLTAQPTVGVDSIATIENNEPEELENLETRAFTGPVLRQMSADSMAAFKRQKEFGYMQYIDSFFRNRSYPKEPAVKETKEETGRSFFSNPGLRMLYWLLAFGAVTWIIWRLFIGSGAVFTRNRKLPAVHASDVEISTIDVPMQSLVDKAIAEGNYRLAIRYLYLQTLSLLGEKELLTLAPQKTNYQYIQELAGKLQQPAFSKLTLQYEYAWYGDFKLSGTQFNKIYHDFQNFIAHNS